MILPNGVTEASMRAALTEFSAIVGNEWFFGPENERLTAYNDAYPLDDLARFAPVAAVAPANVKQIQDLLKVANAYSREHCICDGANRSTQRPAFHSGHCTRGDCGANGWARFC